MCLLLPVAERIAKSFNASKLKIGSTLIMFLLKMKKSQFVN